MPKGFGISDGKGFHVTFSNGWTISVQFGPGNYGDNYREEIGRDGSVASGKRGSNRAEVAAWDANDNWAKLDGDNEVAAYQSPDQVLEIMNRIAAMAPSVKATEVSQ